MNAKTFTKLVVNRMERCEEVLCSKAEEYASNTDRLHNFVVAGRARGLDPVTALDGMMMKHLVSVWDIIDWMETDKNYVPSVALVNDKLGDVINYVLLLEGLIEDRRLLLESK